VFNHIIRKSRKALGLAKGCMLPTAAELKARHAVAFAILHPQVEIAKASPTVQTAVAATIAGLVFTGNWGMAAGLTAAWLGSKPLTHLVADGVAGVGTVDRQVLAAIARLRAAALNAQAEEESAAT
jgi:hypothetical protein